MSNGNQLCLQFIQGHRDSAMDGHPGQAKMLDLLHRQYYWKDMQKQVDQYIPNCHS